MTINRGLWVPINTGNVGTTEVEARLADNALFEPINGTDAKSGLLNPNASTIVTGKANMSFDIAPINPVINRVSGEGVYRFSTTGATNVATTAAPTANSRIDVIWVKQNDQSKGDANNLAVAGVTQGVVAASPVAPAIPAGALELARATIGANITATTSASITQTYRHAALRGTPIRVRNTTERAEISGSRPGQQVARLDLDASGQWIETWDGSAWDAATPDVRIGQGANRAIFQGREYAVAIDQYSVGTIVFDTPFPNALVTASLTRSLNAAGTAAFNILTGPSYPETGKNGIKFVASTGANTTMYVYVQAWGC